MDLKKAAISDVYLLRFTKKIILWNRYPIAFFKVMLILFLKTYDTFACAIYWLLIQWMMV